MAGRRRSAHHLEQGEALGFPLTGLAHAHTLEITYINARRRVRNYWQAATHCTQTVELPKPRMIAFLLLLVPFADSCPTWFHHSQEEPNKCECGSSLEGAVLCNNVTPEVSVLKCFCMTLNGETSNTTVVGKCVFNCGNHSNPSVDVAVHDVFYRPVYPNVTDLNDRSCGYLNRKGRLCGECKDNFSAPAYSYSFHCIHCPETSWIKYFAVAFVPLTGFYFLIIIFSVSVTSPKLKSFCFCAQFIASAQNVRVTLQHIEMNQSVSILVKIIYCLYGFWYLDFFRTLLPPICLQLSNLQTLSLDYIIAVYPLLLVFLTYQLITLYDKDIPIIIKLWKPFQRFFILFKRQWNLKTSIIGAFATFTFLSYEKLLSVSFDLLVPTKAYNMKGEMVGVYLYYDPSVEYMGKEHIPFACMAIIILTVTVFLPLILLILYPMMWFQRFLNCCHLNSVKLRAFMECFQGYYKNRAEEGQEYRYLGALFSILRLLLFILYAVSLSGVFYVLAFLVFTLIGTVFLIYQPYKKEFSVYNKVEGAMMLLLAVHNGGLILIVYNIFADHSFVVLGLVIATITAIIPLVYISALNFHWTYSWCRPLLEHVIRNGCVCHQTHQYESVWHGSADDSEHNQLCDPSAE